MTEPAQTPLSGDEKRIVAALSASRLFAGIDHADITALLPCSRVVQAAAGEEIFQDGDPGQNLYVIAAGAVEIVMETIAPNIRVTLAGLGADDAFGELAFSDDQPRSGTARCRVASELIVVNSGKLREYWDAHPAVGLIFHRNLARLMAGRMRVINHKLLSIVRNRHLINSSNKDNDQR